MTIEHAGGEQVHVVESGPADGPPLLLASGLGGAWFDWDPTVDLLDQDHRVVVFDFPGLGRSPAAHAPPSLRRNVRIMADLAARVGPPVTLLAHSMGAFPAEALARLRPDLLNGLVLVDPSHERSPSGLRLSAGLAPFARALGLVLDATRLARVTGPALRRLVLHFTSDGEDRVPARTVRQVYGRGTVLATVLIENFAYGEMAADLHALRDRRPFPDLPLVVLTALGDGGPSWAEGHRGLAALSPRGRQVVLPRAKHMLQLDRPDVIAAAVAEVLA